MSSMRSVHSAAFASLFFISIFIFILSIRCKFFAVSIGINILKFCARQKSLNQTLTVHRNENLINRFAMGKKLIEMIIDGNEFPV